MRKCIYLYRFITVVKNDKKKNNFKKIAHKHISLKKNYSDFLIAIPEMTIKKTNYVKG